MQDRQFGMLDWCGEWIDRLVDDGWNATLGCLVGLVGLQEDVDGCLA